jgi:protocatechuate 3,4-dioxygenase, beta subunit
MERMDRRRLLFGCSATLALASGSSLAAIAPILTPSATEGPFYPDRLPLDTDNDLVTIVSGGKQASGEIFHLMGRITDQSGAPRQGDRIEIWQCDVNGVYQHSADTGRGTFDPNFQGFGITTTNAQGAYRFRTITPVSYPGRTPHIHFKVKAANGREFTSQVYLDGHRQNKRDFLFGRLGSAQAQRAASVRQLPAPELDKNAVKGTFDIVLR